MFTCNIKCKSGGGISKRKKTYWFSNAEEKSRRSTEQMLFHFY
jgi:hypothetical protein